MTMTEDIYTTCLNSNEYDKNNDVLHILKLPSFTESTP